MESGTLTGLTSHVLDLDATLASGQVFRWRRDADGAWRGTVGRRRVRLASADAGGRLHYEADGPGAAAALRHFLRLDDVDLPALATHWSERDTRFADAWRRNPGIRVLRQERSECFFSFLCASVAPIRRIAGMLDGIARAAGEDRGDGWIAFPDSEALARLSEARLRTMGLGFRAPRVAAAARRLADDPTLLDDIPAGDLDAARTALRAFDGVGAKIADCIALFCLDVDHAVPIDTHIWRLAQTVYAPHLAGKTLTPTNYSQAAQAFVDQFGTHAGWAQQTLFYQAAHKE